MLSAHKEFTGKDLFFQKEEDIKWSSVSLNEVYERQLRLEASVFDIEGKHAREVLNQCKWEVVNLWSDNGLLRHVSYPGRFKRIYVAPEDKGFPFYLPSQINEIYPKPAKFISKKTNVPFDELKVIRNSILLTRSGTIGNFTIVNKTFEGKIFSDDVIRIFSKNENDTGYIYAFLKTKIGQTILQTNNYGAVIQHIEPEHLSQIPIPNPHPIIKLKIHNLVMESFQLRDESNELIDKAELLLIEELHLPPIEAFKPDYIGNGEVRAFSVKLNNLDGRFEATYHVPIVNKILSHLAKHSSEITTLGNPHISKQIILPGRFKRVYVGEGQGIKFIGGRDLFELNPSSGKYLSVRIHKKKIEDELIISENCLFFPSRGTEGSSVGRLAILPKHFTSWIISDNLIKVEFVAKHLIGYVYTFLNTTIGSQLIRRFIFGSGQDAINPEHIANIEIPLLKNKSKQQEINDLVLEANAKRYEAYQLEQEAIKRVNEDVIYAT